MSTLLSLDLSSNDINIVKGSASQSHVNIEKAATFSLPPGCIKDGRIKEKNLLSNALSEALQFGDFNCSKAVLTVNDSAAIIRDLEIPTSKPKTMSQIVQNEMLQTYFADPNSIIQYKITGNKIDEAGDKKTLIRAAAIDNELVYEYYVLLNDLKLKPVAMDININCIEKLINDKTVINDIPIQDISCFVIDFDGNFTNIYIFNNGNLAFYRHTNLSLMELKRSISEKSFLPPQEIDKLIESEFDFFNQDNPEAEKYFNMIKPFLYQFSDELQKLSQFYANRMDGQTIENYFISGSGCILKGFDNYLSNRLNTPVAEIESLSNVAIKNNQKELSQYLNAAGALIRIK